MWVLATRVVSLMPSRCGSSLEQKGHMKADPILAPLQLQLPCSSHR